MPKTEEKIMLTLLRRKKIAKKVLWALAAIIIPAFVLWGAGSLTKKKLPFKYVGTISGRKVSVDDFIKSSKEVQIGLFLSYFSQPDVLNKLQGDRKLLNHLAWENLILKAGAKNDGVGASDAEVIGFVTKHGLFVRGGIFDEKLYKYILKNSLGMTPRTFEENVRGFLINAKYKDELIKNVAASDGELLGSYKREFEKANLYYTVIKKGVFEASVSVSASEIKSFYEKNKNLFKEPEKIVLRYIAFPHNEENQREEALEKLKITYEKLRKRPRDTEKIVRELDLIMSETPAFARDEIVPELNDARGIGIAAFRLRPMIDVMPVLSETESGTSYIVMVKAKLPPGIKSESEASAYITDLLKDKKCTALAGEKAQEIYEKAEAGGLSLKKVSGIYSLKLRETGLITRFDYIEGVGESLKIVNRAFSLKLGEISKPIEARGGFALIEPIEFQFIDEKKFEAEKNDYRNKVLTVKKMGALEDWFRNARAETTLDVNLDQL